MTNNQHSILSKLHCQIMAFIGLCLAMLFVCHSEKIFAESFPTPTPISFYDSISISVLTYDANMPTSDKIYPDKYPMLDYAIDRSRLGDGSSFYTTFYKSALLNAIDEASTYFGSNISVSTTVIDLFMNKFTDIYPFDPLNPQYCVNAFLDIAGNIYFCPDYTISNRLFPIPNNWVTDSDGYVKCMPYGMQSFLVCDHINTNKYYLGFSDYSNSLSNTEQFGLCNGYQTTTNGICFHSYSAPRVSTFSEITFSELDYTNNLPSTIYLYDSDGFYSWASGYQINGSYLYPLVIMSKMYTCGNDITNQSTNVTYSFNLRNWNSYHVCFYVTPALTKSTNLTEDQFYQFCVNWDITYWFKQFATGLKYYSGFEPVIVSPIPTFSPITTPSPVPTFLVPVTITPITLPVNPLINTAYGDPISYVMAMINMVGSVLSSNIVTFFSIVVSYIYNSSIFFEILMFVVPAIVLIAFVVGRLKRK